MECIRFGEIRDGRAVLWEGMRSEEAVSGTHVDCEFASVAETRRLCRQCGRVSVAYERQLVMTLHGPGELSSNWNLLDAYLASCGRVSDAALVCEGCASVRQHVVQTKLSSVARVLAVQVSRSQGEGAELSRFPFSVDEEVSLPGVGPLGLLGVIFRFGRGVGAGHYTCATRGPDGQLWYFDDARDPVRVPEINGFFGKYVDMVFYSSSLVEAVPVRPVVGGPDLASDSKRVRSHISSLRQRAGMTRGSVRPLAALEPGSVLEKLVVSGARLWREREFF